MKKYDRAVANIVVGCIMFYLGSTCAAPYVGFWVNAGIVSLGLYVTLAITIIGFIIFSYGIYRKCRLDDGHE